MWKSTLELLGKILDVGSNAAGAVKDKPIVTATSIIAFIVAVLGVLGYFDGRYASAASTASAADLEAVKTSFQETNKAIQSQMADQMQQTKNISNMLKMQAISRKTILEMKAANHKITPEEKVELQNLREMLRTLGN